MTVVPGEFCGRSFRDKKRLLHEAKLAFPLSWTEGVVANVLDCDIVVSEFELQWRYYVHFQTNILGKDMSLLIPMNSEVK